MSVSPTPVSVVIRARDAAPDLLELLPRLRGQVGVRLSIIIVDNESSDATVDVARRFAAEVVSIGRRDFTWGRALNCGLEHVSDPVALLLSADAIPQSDHWASIMAEAALQPGIAAVFGRQVPRTNAPLDEWLRVRYKFHARPLSWSATDLRDGAVTGLIASNACAAIRIDAWRQVPFDEAALGAEERPWVAEVLRRGLDIRYVPEAVVEHSHREAALRQARRLWELHAQARLRSGSKPSLVDPFWVVGVFSVGRLRNVFRSRAGLWRRLEGAVRLPWEACTLLWVSGVACVKGSHDTMHVRW